MKRRVEKALRVLHDIRIAYERGDPDYRLCAHRHRSMQIEDHVFIVYPRREKPITDKPDSPRLILHMNKKHVWCTDGTPMQELDNPTKEAIQWLIDNT